MWIGFAGEDRRSAKSGMNKEYYKGKHSKRGWLFDGIMRWDFRERKFDLTPARDAIGDQSLPLFYSWVGGWGMLATLLVHGLLGLNDSPAREKRAVHTMIRVLMFGCVWVRVCVCAMCVLTKFTFLREKCGKSQNNHSGKVWEILDNFFSGENGGIEGRLNFEVREALRWVKTGVNRCKFLS